MQTSIRLEVRGSLLVLALVPPEGKPPTLDEGVLPAIEDVLRRIELAPGEVELVDCLVDGEYRSAHRVRPRMLMILSDSPKSFCVGGNIRALLQLNEATVGPWVSLGHRVFNRIEDLRIPVVAQVAGHALGGGLELALACDLLIAADNARFADTHGKWGMSPTWGMSQRLPRRVGLLAAKEFMFSGRVVGGAEAAQMGLANRCVPENELLDSAIAMARGFLENSWFTLRADKMLVNQGLNHTLADGLQFEREKSPGRGPDMEERLRRFGG